jgi:hypothetical protein
MLEIKTRRRRTRWGEKGGLECRREEEWVEWGSRIAAFWGGGGYQASWETRNKSQNILETMMPRSRKFWHKQLRRRKPCFPWVQTVWIWNSFGFLRTGSQCLPQCVSLVDLADPSHRSTTAPEGEGLSVSGSFFSWRGLSCILRRLIWFLID